MQAALDTLKEMRRLTGKSQTEGLSFEELEPFLVADSRLNDVICQASHQLKSLLDMPEWKGLLESDESQLIKALQQDIVNFYDPEVVNPYVPLAARGPWLVTSHGAVLHDSGGYGMLGLGHGPFSVAAMFDESQVMANVMTASFSQKRMTDALNKEIGQTRKTSSPPYRYLFLNSGSEGVTLASRLADLNAFNQTMEGATHHGKQTKFLSLKGSFHGRTDRPAQVSDSSQCIYKQSLYSFRAKDNLVTVPANDCAALIEAFQQANQQSIYIEAVYLEPVLGEGDPGRAVTPEFYQLVRELTEQHQALMIVDSIQAGLRTSGYLSIIDYPAFRKLAPPDIEVFSKAINGGQYPLSVVGITDKVQQFFKVGLYGNTMTANPRALAVGARVLTAMTPSLRKNIVEMGDYAFTEFEQLQHRYPNVIEKVQGKGLLLSITINPAKASVVGRLGLEQQLRQKGIGVIHGGKNALRFTPYFGITPAEINLIVRKLEVLLETLS